VSDARAQAETYAREAQRLRDAGDHYEALTRQRRAVALLRDAGDHVALAHAVRHVADILVDAGRPDEAGASITEMLALYRAAQDAPPLDVANALRSAALHAEAISDSDTAWIFWIQARARYEELDALFEGMNGTPGNPGVAEADAHLARLRG
jgi:tetratricopeptide (TPR) repeat protein